MIDVTHQINEVRREVGTRVLDAGEVRVLTIRQTYPGTLEDVWDACTNPERIPRWFLPISGDLRLGGRYQLEGNAGGTVERCDPPRGFTATWEMGSGMSWIEVTLSETGDGRIQFQLEHLAHLSDELWEQYGPGAAGIGWDGMLVGLTRHLAGAGPVDPAEAAAWMATEEGRQFLALSGELWCLASIAAGTPAPEAEAAAERTMAVYTGEAPPPEH